MIKINLLPMEKRKAERTPLPRFGLIITNVAAVCVVFVIWLFSYMKVNGLIEQLDNKKTELASLADAVVKHDALLTLVTTSDSELANLRKVTNARPFEWWRVMDAVWDVVHAHPRIWLDSIDIIDGRAAEARMKAVDPDNLTRGYHGISLKCHSAGLDVSNFTKFRRALKDNLLLKKMFPDMTYATEWVVAEQAEFVEGASLDFDVVLVYTGIPRE